tara:strand:- start:92 stop:580 length:489 start_codon:yes stop_codon:yes gene_type:complete
MPIKNQAGNKKMVEKNKDSDIQLTAKASIKSIKSSPQKINLVLQQIRGMNAERALNLLEFSKRRIANEVKKILKSAIANAENNHQLDIDKLMVEEATAGKAMVMKRFRPRARGRSGKILKPFSNIRIVVKEKEERKDSNKKNQDSDQQNSYKDQKNEIEEKT